MNKTLKKTGIHLGIATTGIVATFGYFAAKHYAALDALESVGMQNPKLYSTIKHDPCPGSAFYKYHFTTQDNRRGFICSPWLKPAIVVASQPKSGKTP